MELYFLLIPVIVILLIGLRVVAGDRDRDRIGEYVASQGGRLIGADWEPFGPGWYGDRRDRIYVVRYLDRDGNEHQAHGKTSLWSGVYFTEDRIVRYAERPSADHPPAVSVEALESENRRLREELDRLKRDHGQG